VFVDKRFGQILAPPSPMLACTFDHQEVTGRGGSPNRTKFQKLFSRFIDDLTVSMRYEQTRPQPEPSLVGFLLPPEAYDGAITDRLEALLSDASIAVERIAWPPRLDDRLAARLQLFDWVVTDVGPSGATSGLAGYLHGQFVPTLRLAHQAGPDAAAWTASLQASLYGGHEVGYPKDIVSWSTADDLLPAFTKRLARIVRRAAASAPSPTPDYFSAARRGKRSSSATAAPTRIEWRRCRPAAALPIGGVTTATAASRSSPASRGWSRSSPSSIGAPSAS
jgi:hypothetical protein